MLTRLVPPNNESSEHEAVMQLPLLPIDILTLWLCSAGPFVEVSLHGFLNLLIPPDLKRHLRLLKSVGDADDHSLRIVNLLQITRIAKVEIEKVESVACPFTCVAFTEESVREVVRTGKQLCEFALSMRSEVRVNWVGFDSDLEVEKCEVVLVCEDGVLLVARERGCREDPCGVAVR